MAKSGTPAVATAPRCSCGSCERSCSREEGTPSGSDRDRAPNPNAALASIEAIYAGEHVDHQLAARDVDHPHAVLGLGQRVRVKQSAGSGRSSAGASTPTTPMSRRRLRCGIREEARRASRIRGQHLTSRSGTEWVTDGAERCRPPRAPAEPWFRRLAATLALLAATRA